MIVDDAGLYLVCCCLRVVIARRIFGDDILIASSTSYDANYTALKALMAVWNTGASYASRLAAELEATARER